MKTSRKSPRAPHFNYSTPGAYFITICVKGMQTLFGSVENSQMELNPSGLIAKNEWLDLASHYKNLELDEFVVMPNHLHATLWIRDLDDFLNSVGAGLKPAPTHHGLSEIIRGYKTFSARKINALLGTKGIPLWQRSFHDHVIRDEEDLNTHRQYIQNNPMQWEMDKYHP